MSGFTGFRLKVKGTAGKETPPVSNGTLAGFRVSAPATGTQQHVHVDILRTKAFGKTTKLKGTVVRGMYNVRKSSVQPELMHNLKLQLTAKPKESSIGAPRIPYQLWSETNTYFQMPRFFGISKFGLPQKSLLTDGETMHTTIPSTTAPRPYQREPIETIASIFQSKGAGCGVLLEADCGTGKTFLGIEIARRHGRRTAIIVNKGDLQSQFIERIHQYCPTATVGIVRRDVVETENDFVVFMAQSIASDRYDKDVFATFGLVIIDEAHHWVAETLSKTLSKFPSRCVLGLTATPNRKDGLGFMLPYFFGPTAVRMKRRGQQVKVKIVKVPCGKAVEVIGRTGKPILARTITMMTEDPQRNQRIVDMVVKLRQKGRYVLVMGARRKHLVVLRELITEHVECTVGLYVGETTKKGVAKRNAEKDSPILLCTVKMAEEGMDIPRLDTILLVTPKSNVVQCVGRIQRTHPEKKVAPLVVDFYDTYCGGAVHGMARARRRWYEENKFQII